MTWLTSNAMEIGVLSCALVLGLGTGYWCGKRDGARSRWMR